MCQIERRVVGCKCERGDFDARVAEFTDCGKCVGERACAECFVANGEFHSVSIWQCLRLATWPPFYHIEVLVSSLPAALGSILEPRLISCRLKRKSQLRGRSNSTKFIRAIAWG